MHQVDRRARAERIRAPTARAALIRLGALTLLLVGVSVLGYRLGWFDPRRTLEHVSRLRHSHGASVLGIGLVIFLAIGTAVGTPALPFAAASGLLFGTLLGTALSWMGGMVGAVGGYWLARTVGRDVVARWLKRFKHIDGAIDDSRAFGGMLRLRLIPILPLGVTNFVGGLARAPFVPYLGATAIGIIPSMAIYAYFADSFLKGVTKGRSEGWISLAVASVMMIALSLAPRLFRMHASHATQAGSGN